MNTRSNVERQCRPSCDRSGGRHVLRLIVLACLAGSTPLATAGPPFATDDPEPVDLHHSEFYVASQQTLTADGRSGALPAFEFNYGPFPDVQLHLIVPFAFSDPRDGKRQSGLGDIELGLKYRLLEETDSRPMVGIFPLLEVDTGNANRGLGNGATQIFLPVWAQKKWGDWQTYFGGGYWINNAAEARNHWFFGWQVQKALSEHLTLGVEVFHNTEQVAHQGSSSGFNIGGICNLNEHNHFLFSAGRGLSNASATNRFSSYIGYQLTY